MENKDFYELVVHYINNFFGKAKLYKVSDDTMYCKIGEKFFFNIVFKNGVLSLSTYDEDKLALSYLEPIFSKFAEKKPSIVYKKESDNEDLFSYATLAWGKNAKKIIDSILADSVLDKRFKPTNVHEINSDETVMDALSRLDNESTLTKTR